MFLARKFEITKTSRESLLADYGCCLAHPTSLYTPAGASLIFTGRGCLWGAVAARWWSAHIQLGIVFCLVLCTPNFDTYTPDQLHSVVLPKHQSKGLVSGLLLDPPYLVLQFKKLRNHRVREKGHLSGGWGGDS